MKITHLKKLLLLACLCLPVVLYAQKPNWQNLDLKTDSVFGISTEKAYTELLQGKKHIPVLVAVIDDGVDVTHPDLQGVIWTNPKEIAGNGVDDDKNGYADDIHGWDFIGGPKGDVYHDNLEVTRQLRVDKPLFDSVDTNKLSVLEMVKYHQYLVKKADWEAQMKGAQAIMQRTLSYKSIADTIIANLKIADPTAADFKAYTPTTAGQKHLLLVMLSRMDANEHFSHFDKELLDHQLETAKATTNYYLGLDFDPRAIVGDNYNDSSEHFYGNNDVTGPDANHGTHVSGIIGALRDNNTGIKGVANDVRIMAVRTVPDGDERDKDVANAIRYAAANGAKVINMSFGKNYSWDKKAVDEAVKFAVSKDVLLIHAAGNENTNTDSVIVYPNPIYADGSGVAKSWISVGASGFRDDESLKAGFSCYGKTSVDVFAPGVRITSTVMGGKYAAYSGTSMATPVVVGLAALIRSYYPKLTAVQVKEIILKSVTKVNHNVRVPGKTAAVPFSDLCVTGGIVNTYAALQLAATY